jgi:hypothetical protein
MTSRGLGDAIPIKGFFHSSIVPLQGASFKAIMEHNYRIGDVVEIFLMNGDVTE